MRAGESNTLQRHPSVAAGLSVDFSWRCSRAGGHLLRAGRVGKAITFRPQGLLSEAPRGVFPESTSLLQWQPTPWDVFDRWVGQPDDPGLAQGFSRLASLLFLRRDVPGFSARAFGPPAGRTMQPISPINNP